MARKGQISVKTSDVFPIIKKWLYSEHDIFLRELVSNACDAITKRSTLARTQNQETPEGKITVEVSKKNKTIVIHDNGLGMNESEVEKYLAQVAFSGAEEFVNKMKEMGTNAKDEIIGKFGLGFYSAFMVSSKVEVNTLSMNEGSTPVLWSCDGSTEYNFDNSIKNEVGTSITLHINEESEDFLDFYKVNETLKRYCSFLPYSIYLVDVDAEKKADEKLEPINTTKPLWKEDPTTLKDEDYLNFFHKLFPVEPDPLFWIHLNVEHPFELKGILYFPKFNPNKPVQESNIQLFCKQVFVSDSVKNIIPEFLSLLKGAMDSVDIPLNVSRSALQGDPNVKKISNYIIKKVAEALKKLFNNDRSKFEKIWEDIGLFVKYGCVSDNKFDEMMREFVLFKNSEGNYFTLSEYVASTPSDYQEKLKEKVIYFEKGKSDYSLKNQLWQEKIHVIETDSYIDPHFMQHTEMHKTGEKVYKFSSVDSEIENVLANNILNTTESDIKVKEMFEKVLGLEKKTDDKAEANPFDAKTDVEVKGLKNSKFAAYFKVDEQMKRFSQMTKAMGNSDFKMPVKKTLVINPSNPLIQNALKLWDKNDKKELAQKICFYVQDLAHLSSEGLSAEEKEQFVNRSQTLIEELTTLAL